MADGDGVTLTVLEAKALAARLCADLLAEAIDQELIGWDLVPELSESSWERLVQAIDAEAMSAHHMADTLDRMLAVDSRDLLAKAT